MSDRTNRTNHHHDERRASTAADRIGDRSFEICQALRSFCVVLFIVIGEIVDVIVDGDRLHVGHSTINRVFNERLARAALTPPALASWCLMF